jgi:hypothetical protein
VSAKSTYEVDVFSSADDARVTSTEPAEKPSFESLAATFFRLAEARLSDTQKTVLKTSAELLRFHDLTVTALADHVSRRSRVPYSTVKWNLRSLIDMGLLVGGDMASRGAQADLTATAKMLAAYLEQLGS